ncbi:hypothetical protein [Methanolapillus africanus]
MPAERSAAVHLLSERKDIDPEYLTDLILQRLSVENSLYTKIEICSVLEKGGCSTAKKMTAYLGKIGQNQYTALPDSVSKKKSYPLPRDIIARSLGKMDASVLPVLLDVLMSGDASAVSEVLDAIGFLVFYNPQSATPENLDAVLSALTKFSDNDLIQWKLMICLSAFPLPKSLDILNHVIETSEIPIFREEALRSKNLTVHRH